MAKDETIKVPIPLCVARDSEPCFSHLLRFPVCSQAKTKPPLPFLEKS
jgi:hypothetical protein